MKLTKLASAVALHGIASGTASAASFILNVDAAVDTESCRWY